MSENGHGSGGGVLVVGDLRVEDALRMHLPPSIALRSVATTNETEGIDTDLIVVAGEFPLVELTQIRVHPRLSDKPVVLLAPGRTLREVDWHRLDVHIVSDGVGIRDLHTTVMGILSLNGDR